MNNNASAAHDQLTYSAILQVSLVIVCGIIWFIYIIPTWQEINAQSDRTNETIQRYEDTVSEGIPFGELINAVNIVGNNNELIEIINQNVDATKNAIKKTGTWPYLAWLIDALQNSDEDREKLRIAKAKINSIIPTLSPVSGNIDEESITLREYIEYVERDILRAFRLESHSALGIDGLQYTESTETNKTNPIGYFDMNIAFKASNQNIMELLKYLRNTGSPEVLTMEDFGGGDLPWVMSNPLITLQSLSLTHTPNLTNAPMENSGRMTLRLYIRGGSVNDRKFLHEVFVKRKGALETRIREALDQCTMGGTTSCPRLASLEEIEKRYNEFVRSLSPILERNQNAGIDGIYLIWQQIQSIKNLEEEFDTLVR